MTTGRFAPSPSGSLHVGNLRTAVLAWCFARSEGGRFLVRMEDLTTEAVAGHEAEQLADLAALGVDHDGSIWRSSEHVDGYREAIARLEQAGLTYPCFCSRREIREAAEAPHGPGTEGSYPGTCAELSEAQVAERLSQGPLRAIRLRTGGRSVSVRDRLLGDIGRPVDDFVLRRGDGVAAYNLGVVVDDAAQRVDQVVRGDDLVPTTARQVLLQELLDLPTPQYAHVPLVVGPNGKGLSKRHGSVSLSDLAAAGVGPDRVLGMIAESLGLASAGETPSAAQVLERFDPGSVDWSVWTFTPPGG
ncbi:MAG: tRNA glutamyl-Q(34) synthetase GluQRS [Microthrixaceae bacterium]